MKQFLKKVGLFLLPLLLLGLIAEILLRRIPNEYAYKSKYLDQHADSINTLILGSSHGYLDINPEYLHNNSFNAALSSQSIDYDLRILQKYDAQLTHLKYVVVPVSYFTLFTDLTEAPEAWRVKFYNIYYGFHSSSRFNDYTEILCGSLELNTKRLIRYYALKREMVECNKLGWALPFPEKKDVVASGAEGAKKHTIHSRRLFEKHSKILSDIIGIAAKHHATVLFFTAPAYETYYNNLDTNQLNITLRTVESLVSNHDNVKYYNFLKDSSFTIPDFYDGDHLSQLGAQKFTLKLDSIIQHIDATASKNN